MRLIVSSCDHAMTTKAYVQPLTFVFCHCWDKVAGACARVGAQQMQAGACRGCRDRSVCRAILGSASANREKTHG